MTFPFNEKFKDVLNDKYLFNVSRWLLGDPKEDSILARKSGSSWESALSVLFLLEFNSITNDYEIKKEIKRKILSTVRWLLDTSIQKKKTQISWEGVTWDTAVVLRALLYSFSSFQKELTTEKDTITSHCLHGIEWMHQTFSKWNTEVKYPFGQADLAQIIITNCSIIKDFTWIKEKYEQSGKSLFTETKGIASYLLHSKEIIKNKDVETFVWDDYFTTAEVIESLGYFYECSSSLNRPEGLGEVAKTIQGACMYFEYNQMNGMWGSHIDTIKVVNAYVFISKIKNIDTGLYIIEPEVHTIFKAIRWICDEKQVFTDGSFLHTMFLTAFYSNTLIQIHNYWKFADFKVDDLYDHVVWCSPVRYTPERSLRINSEIENTKLKKKISEKDHTIYKYSIALIVLILSTLIMFLLSGIDVRKGENFYRALSLIIAFNILFIKIAAFIKNKKDL